MTTSNVSEQTCYGTGGKRADAPNGDGSISLGIDIDHGGRSIPSMWDATSPTPPAHRLHAESSSLREKLFGVGHAVDFIGCGGPCVSNSKLEQAFAGC
jgi:hypothetical protein